MEPNSRRPRHVQLRLDKAKLMRQHRQVKRLTASGYSRQYIAAKLGLSLDDVFELRRESPF